MRKSEVTDEQVALSLKHVEQGISVQEVCRKLDISDATFDVWRKKYGDIAPSELFPLRQSKDENRKLAQIVVDMSLGKAIASHREVCPARPEAVGLDLPARGGEEGRIYAGDADQGDHPAARALWIPPCAGSAAPRRPEA
jgi:putative transposase